MADPSVPSDPLTPGDLYEIYIEPNRYTIVNGMDPREYFDRLRELRVLTSDDTELIMAEILENGYDSERAKQAFRRMNQMHNRYSISNDDFLYVLTTFIYQPSYWTEKYVWRKPTEIEKQAIFLFYT